MDILLNELSVQGQFASIQEFVDDVLPSFLEVLDDVDESNDLIYKKYDLFSSMVTPDTNLHAILIGDYSRQYDIIRRFKSKLVSLFKDPYWEETQKHSIDTPYLYKGEDIAGTSLAESCERDKVVISLPCADFYSGKLIIQKQAKELIVDNLFAAGHYTAVAEERGLIKEFSLTDTDRFRKTSHGYHAKAIFQEIRTGYYWYLDNLHKDHYEVFDSSEKHLGVADMDGNIDRTKKVKGRTISF